MDPVHLQIIDDMKICQKCVLAQGRTQVVVGDYGPVGGICFVGEAPGAQEDKQGRPFVGQSGKLLDRMLEEVGLSREKVSVLNICKCRPPGNRNPTPEEQRMCGGLWLEKQLKYLKPRMVVTLGSVPLGYFVKGARITRSKGKLIDGEKFPVFPMF
ncbi:MAG: uracil-DNA glycosylase, partial [Candidatus Kariarchaeaceae archaeon]